MTENLDALIFDVDNTIVQRWTTNLLRNRKQRLDKLKEEGKRIYLATNQGGPAHHAWHYYRDDARAEEYPSLIRTIGMMADITTRANATRCYVALHPGAPDVAKEIFDKMTSGPDQVMYLMGDKVRACYRLSWRKPAPGMLLEIIEEMDGRRERCAYVGNDTKDMLAAQAAGIEFIDSDEFFLGGWPR